MPVTLRTHPEESSREIELSVTGMTCAACAVRVQKKLAKLDGVTASVNYATGTAHVTAPAGVPVETLTGAVEAAGYSARPAATDDDRDSAAAQHATYLWHRLIVALVFFVPLTDLSLTLSLIPSVRFPGWPWVLIGCAAPVALWSAWPFHRAALINARHGTFTMDTLVSLGITAACGWSVYAMFVLDRHPTGQSGWHELLHGSGGGGIYLEVAATVTTFLLAGRLYEARARRNAGAAMRELAGSGARDVGLLATDGTERRVPVAELRPGDMFVVRPGETIAADGEVLFGQTAVDRSMMTGESVPAETTEGDLVIGGTVVLTGRLVVRATRVGADTQLAQLVRLVEQAQGQKASIQRFADRICGVFVPAVLASAILTLAGWLLAGAAAGHAVSAGLAVLIIACPCALGLATPAALVAACGRGAQLGIFIKGYQALESSRAADTVVLDKTGTVTTGQMTLAHTRTAVGVTRAELLRCAGAVEQASEHAVAAAITEAAQSPDPLPSAGRFRALPGLGASGVVDGHEVIVGRARLLADRGLSIPPDLAATCRSWEQAGCTSVLAAWDGEVRGALAVTDTVKPSAAPAVAALRALGLHPVLLTGDNQATARAVAAAVGIDEVIAETLPDGKAAVITGLQDRGHAVAMVGDGVNDAPALAAATIGLALGSGTDVAMSAADLILLRDDLTGAADAIRLSRATFRTIRRNLAWAFGYNLAALPLAALGLLNPIVASAAMTLSSVFVVWNSLRLGKFSAGSYLK
ncbi:MAG TPA: heavy metal translocating P-type ATPase [Streptosporangiaceae bacterium]|nr:heavy metal translocating P-type ATPase [Streptosporangiaceae bacterium]